MGISSILTAAQSGGFAKPSLYEVTPPSDSYVTVKQFLIKSASLPAHTIGTIEIPYRGRKVKIPSNITHEPWQINVIYETSDTDIRANFQEWIDDIQSPKADLENLSEWGETWKVSLLDPVDHDVINDSEFTLHGCYPSELGTVSLDTETTDSLAEFSVTLYYSYHTMH